MKKTILQFSGGRDSTVLLHKMRHLNEHIRVVWINSGAAFPHVERHVREMCSKFEFILDVVGPVRDLDTLHATDGLPVDILPIENHRDMAPYVPGLKREAFLQSWMECCTKQMWLPMDAYLEEREVQVVYLGTRKDEPRRGWYGPVYYNGSGVQYLCPLWSWTEDEIMAYIEKHDLPLPEQYKWGCDSLDCWSCTAALDKHGETKIIYMKERYPHLYEELMKRLRKIRDLTAPHMDRLNRIVGE
jgi:3'-phosphoadenosine 5'-phosphosulfate sulfotransferase (PAPS reductase)/FAD synthetase